MASDSRLPIIIFGAILTIIALPFLIDHLRERRRPVLVEAKIVTATNSDPVYREGRRRVSPGDWIEIALALRLQRSGGDDQWLSPAARLEIGGEEIPHLQSSDWPDDDRLLRVFWFTVESSYLGGALEEETVAERLRYRTFLAMEMGRGLQAEQPPENHNDDHLGVPDNEWSRTPMVPAGSAGTFRIYARVEVVEKATTVRPLQAATTIGVAQIFDPLFPTVSRAANLGDNINPRAAELFGLPGFEPKGESPADRNEVTTAAFGRPFTDLVDERVVVSSWTLASTALTGRSTLDPSTLRSLGQILINNDRCTKDRRPIVWGDHVRPGDLLSDNTHWLILLGDDGNGVLDPHDAVLHSWGRPPVETTILAAVGSDGLRLEHRRAKN